MLKTRFLTACVLLSVFLFVLFASPQLIWALFATLIALLAAWEWGALMRLCSSMRIALSFTMLLICLALIMFVPTALGISADWQENTPAFFRSAWQFGRWLYVPALIFWLILAPLWIIKRWSLQALPPVAALAVGFLLILPTWLALIQLRRAGALELLIIMSFVWLADIAAYFSGRRFGKHKLAPSISPGKTQEGAFGAICCVCVYGLFFLPKLSLSLPSLTAFNQALVLFSFLLLLVFLTALSIFGDLFESLLKRQVNIKDSSRLLPGHGGILDRIDSLTSTLPLVALLWLLSRIA
ncbi:MAG: phosphatidate cytidylyltransferase [Pseudomonadota bacterium]